ELAERFEQELQAGSEPRPGLERLEAEHENLRAALAWCESSCRCELHLRLASALRSFWELRDHLQEGRRFLGAALAAADEEPSELRARALSVAARLAHRQLDLDEARRI